MEYAGMVSVAALIVSIISAVYTYILYRREVKNQGYQLAMSMFIDWDKILIEHPELRPYLYERERVEEGGSSINFERLMAAAEMFLDICELVVGTKLGMLPADEKAWHAYVVDCLKTGPILIDHLERYPKWHPRVYELYKLHRDTISPEGLVADSK